MGGAEEIFQLGSEEGIPALKSDPVGTGEIGRGDDTFDFKQLVVALGTGGEHEVGASEARAGIVKVDEGEHLAANGFIAGPEDEVIAHH